MGTALVVGCGLIGTSVGLALSARGVRVLLSDIDPDAVREAADAGGGEPWVAGRGGEPACDVAVVAAPPQATADAVVAALDVADVVLDCASVKGPVVAAVRAGTDSPAFARFVPSHPMAGSHRSGPSGARADLFAERVWVLTPEGADAEAVAVARQVVDLCGARAVVRTAAHHDEQVALVSHLPQAVVSALAARLAEAPAEALDLAGPGVRDTTRIAGSSADLWADVLSANSEALRPLLRAVATDLESLAEALGGEPARASSAAQDLVRRGNLGRARLDGRSR